MRKIEVAAMYRDTKRYCKHYKINSVLILKHALKTPLNAIEYIKDRITNPVVVCQPQQ